MEAIAIFAVKAIVAIILLIFLLLLSELGILKYAYEELYTNPKINTTGMFLLELFSDMFYVVGFSIIASVVFAVTTTTDGFQYGTFILGLVSAIIGKYLKEKKAKGV